MADDIINQLLSSRAIPRCKVQLHSICRIWDTSGRGWETPSPPSAKFSAYNKTQNSRRVKVHKKFCTKPCHSLIYLPSLTLDLAKCPRLFYSFISTLFTPFFLDAWLFLSPLFQYAETHSTIGVARTLHKSSRICFASSNDQCLGIFTTKQCSKLIWSTCCFDSQLIWKWCR